MIIYICTKDIGNKIQKIRTKIQKIIKKEKQKMTIFTKEEKFKQKESHVNIRDKTLKIQLTSPLPYI